MQSKLVIPQYNPFRHCVVGPAPVPFQPVRPVHQKQAARPVWRLALAGFCIALFMVFLSQKPAGLASMVPQQVYKLPGFAFLTKGQPETAVSKNAMPVHYTYISSAFGMRNGRPHQGMDFAAPHGANILAATQGKVIVAGWQPGYGQTVILDHGNGLKTRYAHCSRILVKQGDSVKLGAIIAKVGSTGHSTGPHLHFEVIEQGVHRNPAPFLALK